MKNIDFDLNGFRKLNEKVKSDENTTIDNMDSSCLVSVLVYLCSDRTANWSQHLITKGKILWRLAIEIMQNPLECTFK